MTIIEAIILGIIQGLTEFIPISSTAHLTVAGKLMGLISEDNPERWTAFIAMIQLGTLAAVFIYFKREIVGIPKSFLTENFSKNRTKYSEQSLDSRMGWMIILGTIPIVIAGLAFKDFIEGSFTKELNVIATSLIVLGIILFIAEKTANFKKDLEKITIKDSILVGLAQCVALIPGSSRSGTTITAGLFLGMTRETAARFSFLLSIPAILASGLLGVKESIPYLTGGDAINIIIATIVSGISGYWAIHFLISYLKNNSTYLFVIYRIIAGVLILLFINHF
ncbi:MAG: undecaprenyl-diphosphatase UppP [Candidatus Kapabacteria bacterium]|nr:undecaprenyl-diphosphatase UppP [Ignavibacteriota bacterium]MCW5886236.1 undecaprenyl-diphosphatase UppP [Candidatus Kapabacteria bacterium]